MSTLKKPIYLLSVCLLFMAMTTCRNGGSGHLGTGRVVVVNETVFQDKPECLTAEVFYANALEGTPIQRFQDCKKLHIEVAPAGDYFIRIRGDQSQAELFGNFISVEAGKDTALTVLSKPLHLPLEILLAGAGTGKITSSPLGIQCGQDCSHLYQSGTKVKLQAKPDAWSDFAGWTGDCNGKETSCEVVVSKITSVTAVFHARQLPLGNQRLTVLTSGNGSGIVFSHPSGLQCEGNCDQFYQTNTVVELHAIAKEGSVFVGWSGACSGVHSCHATLDEPRAVQAHFVQKFRPEENHVAWKSYEPLSWELFDRGFDPSMGPNAIPFALPQLFHVTRGCSGDQWVTLHIATRDESGAIHRSVCIYRDFDPVLENAYTFSHCTSAREYDLSCAINVNNIGCARTANSWKGGDVVWPLEITLFVNDGDPSCGITEIRSFLINDGGENDDGDGNAGDNGDNGEGEDDGDDDDCEDPNHHGQDHDHNHEDDPNHHGDEHSGDDHEHCKP